ncbi:hypothetical protein V8E55_002624 [Tylopilus felleus]
MISYSRDYGMQLADTPIYISFYVTMDRVTSIHVHRCPSRWNMVLRNTTQIPVVNPVHICVVFGCEQLHLPWSTSDVSTGRASHPFITWVFLYWQFRVPCSRVLNCSSRRYNSGPMGTRAKHMRGEIGLQGSFTLLASLLAGAIEDDISVPAYRQRVGVHWCLASLDDVRNGKDDITILLWKWSMRSISPLSAATAVLSITPAIPN